MTNLSNKLCRSRARALVVVSVILLGMFPPAVSATTTTALLAVSATVLSVCGVAATPLVFGNYSATSGSPTTTTSTITAICTSGVAYTIAMNAGTGTGSTVAQRVMMSGSNTLNYSIYSNSAHTTVWGDGTDSTSTITGTAGLLPTTYTAYGSIPTAQQAPTGAYLDTVTVSLTY